MYLSRVAPERSSLDGVRRGWAATRRLAWLAMLGIVATAPAVRAEQVGLINISGAIGPATAGTLQRAIRQSTDRQYVCLIIQLDTPGGLLDSTKQIVQMFYASPVPTVVYVAPSGATAASAGCFVTLAADVAAMAPSTTIGAAHPVELGGSGTAEQSDPVMKTKLENYASTFIESIAAKRRHNVEWAKSSVVASAAVTAEKALELKVVDIVATDVQDLLRQLDGRQVEGRTLHTASSQVEQIPLLLRERFFQMLWRPEVMFILMLVAIYGIIGELSNPGAILPGVTGAIALVLALYMSSILPVDVAALALIGLAVGLFVADVFAQTHGVLTVGGVISFFLGSMMLFDKAGPAFRLSLGLIIPATVITALFFAFVLGAGLRAQRLPTRTGKEAMVGRTCTALTPITTESGKVFIEGAYWNAVSESAIEQGKTVEIVGVDGLKVKVRAKD
jgi:membrane-bound serine protease (ClpP class)